VIFVFIASTTPAGLGLRKESLSHRSAAAVPTREAVRVAVK
jgi:hypothetical protein